MAYEKRDTDFAKWLEDGDVPLPVEPTSRAIAVEALRNAFNAGWAARKNAAYEGRLH